MGGYGTRARCRPIQPVGRRLCCGRRVRCLGQALVVFVRARGGRETMVWPVCVDEPTGAGGARLGVAGEADAGRAFSERGDRVRLRPGDDQHDPVSRLAVQGVHKELQSECEGE